MGNETSNIQGPEGNKDVTETELKRAEHQALLEAFGTEVYDRIPLAFPVTFSYNDQKTGREYASTKIEAPDTNGRLNVYLNGEGVSDAMLQRVNVLIGPLMDAGLVKELNFHTDFKKPQKHEQTLDTFLEPQ